MKHVTLEKIFEMTIYNYLSKITYVQTQIYVNMFGLLYYFNFSLGYFKKLLNSLFSLELRQNP